MARAIVRAAALLAILSSMPARAQQLRADTSACDSVVFASRVDSVRAALFILVSRADGPMSREQARAIEGNVATSFEPPRPFRLSVFSGPVQMRSLRRMNADTIAELRAPTVTGVYRFWSNPKQPNVRAFPVRASLLPGFDAAAMASIEAAAALKSIFAPPTGSDSMLVEVRFSTDSLANAQRIIEAVFPRMRTVDARPDRNSPQPVFPNEERGDETTRGEVVLSFVVDRAGLPALETVELVRGTSMAFVRSALNALPNQRFSPASINGCAVAQMVQYSFGFVSDVGRPPPRH